MKNQEELKALRTIKDLPEVKPAFSVKYPKEAFPEGSQPPTLQMKPICLILAQMHGLMSIFGENERLLEKDMETILRTIPSYIDIILSTVVQLIMLKRAGMTNKNINCQNILAVIQFSQNLMQQGWKNRDQFMQIPGFTAEHCQRLKAASQGLTLYKYATLQQAERK